MKEHNFGPHVHIMDHPLVSHKLTIMRDKDTSVKDFRELVSEIGMLITYEATRDLPMTTKHIETPICEMDAPTLAGKKFAVVPILRAGLGLVDGVLRMVPSARVGHIGMFRDEETLIPHVYFCKMPKDVAERDILIVDPMLATGGSAAAAIDEMKKRGCKHIKLMVLVAAPEGIEYLIKNHRRRARRSPQRARLYRTGSGRRRRSDLRNEVTPPDLFAQGRVVWARRTHGTPSPTRLALNENLSPVHRRIFSGNAALEKVRRTARTPSSCLAEKSHAGDEI